MRFVRNFERDLRNAIGAKFGMRFGKCDLLKTSNVICAKFGMGFAIFARRKANCGVSFLATVPYASHDLACKTLSLP